MVTKTYKGIVGYGVSNEEAEDNCKIISVLQDAYNIKGFSGLEERRLDLAPWAPRNNTLHTKKTGYVRCCNDEQNNLCISSNGTLVRVSNSLFSTIYRSFYGKADMVDIALFSRELSNFFESNGIEFNSFNDYSQIIPETVVLDDDDVTVVVVTDDYTIVLYSSNKVSMKRNSEDYYWTYNYCGDACETSIIDSIYYLSYMRGYSGVDDIIREVYDGGIYKKS